MSYQPIVVDKIKSFVYDTVMEHKNFTEAEVESIHKAVNEALEQDAIRGCPELAYRQTNGEGSGRIEMAFFYDNQTGKFFPTIYVTCSAKGCGLKTDYNRCSVVQGLSIQVPGFPSE